MGNKETPRFDQVQVGDEIPQLSLPPVSRLMLALYAGASGDHNAIHIDLDAARKAGLSDVFAQGMLGMAWLGRAITAWAPQAQLRRYDVRFQGITHLGHAVTCRGRVAEKLKGDGGSENRVVLELATVNQYGQTRIAGTAVVALP